MRTFVTGLLLSCVCLTCAGCAEKKVVTEELPPPPPKVEVTVPEEATFKDVEGVRRVAVSLPLERQPNGRLIGRGFSDRGVVVELELARPLDEVVQFTVASAFKELGFNVTLAPPLELERSAEVRTHLERHQADYMVTVVINELLISAAPVPNAPTFARVNLELQVFGSGGGLLTPVVVTVNTGRKLDSTKPGPEDMRRCVEDLLREIKRRITTDVNLLNTLGLQLPAAAAQQP